METMLKEEFIPRKRVLVKKFRDAVFIYPTDTIYGIGCNAEETDLVERIRNLKRRFDMPFSIIVPSKEWIIENCVIDKTAEKWLEKLPGPYTLIMRLKNKESIAPNVNLNKDTIGIRIPDNWFSKIVSEMGVPVITTSANVSGNDFMTSLDNLSPTIRKGVDFFIDVGEIHGSPSTLVFLNEEEATLKKR